MSEGLDGENVMKRALIVVLMLTLVTASALADTKNGNTSQNTFQRWRFTTPGGDITTTITWTNRNVSTMLHLIVCGTGPTGAIQPFFAAISTSTHDRINSSTTGIRAGFVCTIFVRTRGGGATAYRMNTRNSTDIGLTKVPPGLTLVEDTTRGGYVEALAWGRSG